MATATVPMTTEELFALPDDGIDRELIRGELREIPMTRRNIGHSSSEARIGRFLDTWLDGQPEPRGVVASGEAGCRLLSNPDTSVGIDVAYFSAEMVAASAGKTFFDGPPILAVEILSPSDQVGDVDDKVELYLEAGVALVWIVNPRFRTILAFQPGAEPELFTASRELTAEPVLPGFRVPVSRLFGI